jgi:hypothetical protein
MRDDQSLIINRDQVKVLPNYSLTDYASQGKTRINNVIDLKICRTHQSYYVCLSRSASAAGTVILQGFHPGKISKGLSGYLRQEFRELELLDEITKLNYENKLPNSVVGQVRYSLIQKYREWKGTSYVPENVHSSIRWSESNPFPQKENCTEIPFKFIQKGKKNQKVSIIKSTNDSMNVDPTPPRINTQAGILSTQATLIPSQSQIQRTNSAENGTDSDTILEGDTDTDSGPDDESKTQKRVRFSLEASQLCLKWDSQNWSCAYDSFLIILFSIYFASPVDAELKFGEVGNALLRETMDDIKLIEQGRGSLEGVRNRIRRKMNNINAVRFPYGKTGAVVSDVSELLTKPAFPNVIKTQVCYNCSLENTQRIPIPTLTIPAFLRNAISTQDAVQNFHRSTSSRNCGGCNMPFQTWKVFVNKPSLIVLDISGQDVIISPNIDIPCINDENVSLQLRGIIYHGGYHFIARIIGKDGTIFEHDGDARNGEVTETDDNLKVINLDYLKECHSKSATLAIYSSI